MKKLAFLLTLLVATTAAVADEEIDNKYLVSSPEVDAMTRYGSYPVGMYTGSLSLSIPLYTIKNQDFEIPISVSYDATGFMPNQDATCVGQNWTLHYGGMIVREIHGVADDMYDNVYDDSGVLDIIESSHFAFPPKSDLKDLNKIDTYYLMGRDSYSKYGIQYRFEPDIYTVMLPDGSSFKFTIDNSGKPQVIGKRPCKIDISKYESIRRGTPEDEITSVIKVTDENGYVYTFGGNLSYLERSYGFHKDIGVEIGAGVTNAWYLASIVSPYGSAITYTYKSTSIPSGVTDNNLFLKTICGKMAPVHKYTFAFTKQVLPVSITSSNIKIDFHYSLPDKTFYGNYVNKISMAYSKPNYQLNDITITEITGSGTPASRQIKFTYEHVGSSWWEFIGYRRYLKKVDVSGKPYTMNYNTDGLPFPITEKVDKYGFYCASCGSSGGRENDRRNPGTGMISSITYPTGGTTSFEFENHQYNFKVQRVTKDNIHSMGATIYGTRDSGIGEIGCISSGTIGGVRIKRMTNSDGTVTEYDYDDGVYYQSLNHFYHILQGANNTLYLLDGYSDCFNYTTSSNYRGESRIGYGQVTEKRRSTDGGQEIKSVYKYSTRKTVPDIPPVLKMINHGSITTTPNTFENLTEGGLFKVILGERQTSYNTIKDYIEMLNLRIKYSSRAAERGLVQSISKYDGSKLVEETSFEYSLSRSQRNDYTVSAELFESSPIYNITAYSYLTYLYTCEPSRKVTTTYNDNGSVTETETYTRAGLTRQSNQHNMVTSMTRTNSTGRSVTTKYKRPLDYGTLPNKCDNATRGLYMLQQNNILSPVIETTVTENGKVTQSTIIEYNYNSSCRLSLPKYKYVADKAFPVSSYKESAVSGGVFTYSKDMYSLHLTYDLYSRCGRLLQYTDRSGVPVSFIWGYAHQKIIAKVIGGDYSSFSTNWGESDGINNMYNKGRSKTPSESHYNTINSLRSSSLVTTYRYNPLNGVTSITGPTGVTTYYDYNTAGELTSEYRLNSSGGRELIHKYKYHYKNQTN